MRPSSITHKLYQLSNLARGSASIQHPPAVTIRRRPWLCRYSRVPDASKPEGGVHQVYTRRKSGVNPENSLRGLSKGTEHSSLNSYVCEASIGASESAIPLVHSITYPFNDHAGDIWAGILVGRAGCIQAEGVHQVYIGCTSGVHQV